MTHILVFLSRSSSLDGGGHLHGRSTKSCILFRQTRQSRHEASDRYTPIRIGWGGRTPQSVVMATSGRELLRDVIMNLVDNQNIGNSLHSNLQAISNRPTKKVIFKQTMRIRYKQLDMTHKKEDEKTEIKRQKRKNLITLPARLNPA
ncbi:hypothetical protein GHT06_014342 [Daphnia sinensis]|uniref:Uncharacterized protein n=1 Tax=Daphnia sinensis TaxID=1820382 RepID=A0AAD5PYT9_9CRUS|nr:hypothetical protein GHT06_014342 [Daphnia sinensis]